MKNLFCIILALCIAVSLVGCGGSSADTPAKIPEKTVDITGLWVSVEDSQQTLTLEKNGTYIQLTKPPMVDGGSLIVGGGMIQIDGESFQFDIDTEQSDGEEAGEDGFVQYDFGSMQIGGESDQLVENTGEYAYDEKQDMITVFSLVDMTLFVRKVDGVPVLTNVSEMVAYVRPENYDTFHAKHQQEKEDAMEDLLDTMMEQYKELTLDRMYAITNETYLTVTDCYIGEQPDEEGMYTFYMELYLENLGEDRLCLSSGHTQLVDGVFEVIPCDLPINACVMKFTDPIGGFSMMNTGIPMDQLYDNPDGTNRETTDPLHTRYLEAGSEAVYYLAAHKLPTNDPSQAEDLLIFRCGEVEFAFHINEIL